MNREQVVNIAEEVAEDHRCHTIVLYGSWARGDPTAGSDIDLLCVREGGTRMRDARLVKGVYLDAFIYPEDALAVADPSLLRLVGGVVLRERAGFGRGLLARVEELNDRGPDPMPSDESHARIVWARKMLERIRTPDDPDANYRRMFLLMQSLEDYFVLENRWFRGSKEALGWLRENDPKSYVLFDAAFRPGAPAETLAELVDAVYGGTGDG